MSRTTMTTTAAEPETTEPVIELEHGIPGLTEHTRFVLRPLGDDDDAAFHVLASTEDPDVALIVTVPWTFFPDYAPELPEPDRQELGIDEPEEAIVFCPVTLDAAQRTVYLNLLGPFVVHAGSRRGRQVVLADSEWPVRAPVRLDTT